MGWRVVLAQGTPPMRAAAKRRSQAELGCVVGRDAEFYGALVGRLTAERRFGSASEEPPIRKRRIGRDSLGENMLIPGTETEMSIRRPHEITNRGGVLETDAARAKPRLT
jgi:hypothetical protein